MFVTITNANYSHISLNTPIDNRDGEKRIAIREIFYSINWNNISEKLGNNYIKVDGQTHKIKDGYYDFCSLVKKLFEPHEIHGQLDATNMHASLTIPAGKSIELSPLLTKQLGFTNSKFTRAGAQGLSYTGMHEIDLAINRMLYIHLGQLSTSDNLLNGKPSQILRVIPAGKGAYCETESVSFTELQYKKLERGCFDSLSIEITNTNGQTLTAEI